MLYNVDEIFSDFEENLKDHLDYNKEFGAEIKEFIGWGNPDFLAIISPENPVFFVYEKNLRFDFAGKEETTLTIIQNLVEEHAELAFKIDKLTMSFILEYVKKPLDVLFQLKGNVEFVPGNPRRFIRNIRILSIDETGRANIGIMGVTDITETPEITRPVFRIVVGENADIDMKAVKRLEEEVKEILEPKTEINFTKREKQILREIALGKTSTEIADILNISKATVDKHRQNMIRKFGVKNTASLIQRARKDGII